MFPPNERDGREGGRRKGRSDEEKDVTIEKEEEGDEGMRDGIKRRKKESVFFEGHKNKKKQSSR